MLFAAGILGAMLRSKHAYPRPGADLNTVRAYFDQPSLAARLGAAGQRASATALAAFTPETLSASTAAGPAAKVGDVPE